MHHLRRREFTAGMLTSYSAAIALSTMPRIAKAADGKTWRVAVIGHTGRGDYGHGLDTMWRRVPGTEVVAVADGGGVDSAAKRLPGVKAFVDYVSMLQKVRPDIVAIAPRHVDQHHAMCLAAAAAGVKGIYIEKPFCRTPREADEIVEACNAKGVLLAVAHRNRYHPVLPVIKQQIESGLIGKLLEIRMRGKEDHRGGAQDLWVLGCHLANVANYFTGSPVACSGMLYQDGRPCTDADLRMGDEGIGPIAGNEVHARFEMADGTPVFFDSIQNHGDRNASFGLQMIGTGGVIDFRIDKEPLASIRRGNPHNPSLASEPWIPISSGGIGKPEPIRDLGARLASHQAAGEDLVSALEQGRQPLCDALQGRTTVEMICAVFESHRRGGARIELASLRRDHPLAT